jgi:RNA recognition motif-containing protein
MNIYVGNLAYSVTDNDLRELFSEYGEVAGVSVIIDKRSGRPKGFGFVEMPNQQEAEAAISALNETSVQGRDIKVNEARPREDNPAR